MERSREVSETGDTLALAAVMKEVRVIRKQGFVLSNKTVTPGGGLLGMMLPHEIDDSNWLFVSAASARWS